MPRESYPGAASTESPRDQPLEKKSGALHHRKHLQSQNNEAGAPLLADQTIDPTDFVDETEVTCCGRFSRWMQNKSYDWMAYTFWDGIVSGFRPGRIKAIRLLDIQSTDKVLLVGEGSGLDFECLPETIDKLQLIAFDFSPEMVRQSKLKAQLYGIPEENCFIGDAQALPFEIEKFDKIYFPLSLASIPNPMLALQEAERVLAPGGKIVIFDKLIDDETPVTYGRQAVNLITQSLFADINRKLSVILGNDSPLKIIGYESLNGQLGGFFANAVSDHYRLAVLVRERDYPEQPAQIASLNR